MYTNPLVTTTYNEEEKAIMRAQRAHRRIGWSVSGGVATSGDPLDRAETRVNERGHGLGWLRTPLVQDADGLDDPVR